MLSVATDKHGIMLVKAALDKNNWLQSLQAPILSHLAELALDVYGNFAVQKILTARPEHHMSFFENQILPKDFLKLSVNKFSSNVLDKVIQSCEKAQIASMMQHLARQEESSLRELVLSQFGNFPLQNLLNEAINYRGCENETIAAALDSLLTKLQSVIQAATAPSNDNSLPRASQSVKSKWLQLIAGYRRGERSESSSRPNEARK